VQGRFSSLSFARKDSMSLSMISKVVLDDSMDDSRSCAHWHCLWRYIDR
jgi:hypothetical protein